MEFAPQYLKKRASFLNLQRGQSLPFSDTELNWKTLNNKTPPTAANY